MKLTTFVALLLTVATVLCIDFFRSDSGATTNKTNIAIHNTHAAGTELETKCDYNPKKQNYTFYQKIFIPRYSNRTISVPFGLHNCEIWVTKVVLW